MIEDLWLIGIGTGNPNHVTLEGMEAIRRAGTILLPTKGEEKDALAALRRDIIAASGSAAEVLPFAYPERDESLPYRDRVAAWHDEIAAFWAKTASGRRGTGPVALLVWGDPSLYDSTLRIAGRLDPPPSVRVVPGITAIQALTAAHGIPLNTVGNAVIATTARNLRDSGWPKGADTVVVVLDGETAFLDLDPVGIDIWWGAYLGMETELLHSGALDRLGPTIAEARKAARARHGWIMDTYLLRRRME